MINFLTEVYDNMPAAQAPIADEWKLYNRELTPNEITILSQNQIYNGYKVTNGDFSNGLSGWTGSLGAISVSNNNPKATISIATNGANYFGQAVSTTPGSTYKVTYDLISTTTTAQSYAFTIATGGNRRDSTYLNTPNAVSGKSTPGTYSYNFIATSSSSDIVFATEVASSGNSVIDNVSVQLLP